MKINSPNDPALAAGAAATARNGRSAAAPVATAGAAAASGAPVSVSETARALDTTAAGSGIDWAKVAAMRAAIASGTFTANAHTIADKLLSNAQEFLSRDGSN